GRSLFEALMLNGPPTPEARMGAITEDKPVWKRNAPKTYRKRIHTGLLDVLTWPSRRLTLVTEENNDGVVATGVYLTQGDKLDPDPADDPLTAYIESDKKGRFPLGFRAGRAVWRDSAALFDTRDPSGAGAPKTFRWVAKNTALGEILRTHGFDAFGLVNDQAKAELWRHERLPLHVEILRDEGRWQYVNGALERARDVLLHKKHGLRRALRVTAEFALAPPAPGDDAYPSADTKAVTALAASLGAESRYWAALEPAFLAYLARVAQAENQAARVLLLDDWNQITYDTALQAFDAATSSFDGGARHLRALAKGRARLHGLKPAALETNPDDTPLEPTEPMPALPPLPLFS
ncbi:MAG: type I-E CRISPR-associated protein Cse1/CasA, partial [Bacteroidota bacterium]